MRSLADLCSLAGHRAIVTGAATGIGEAVARRFADAGAELLLIDRDATLLALVADALGAQSRVADVTDWAMAEQVATSIDADILVNCAGLYPSGPLLDLD